MPDKIETTLNVEILKGRKDIPPEIRALMGEIEEPSENVMLTISKMSKLYEIGRFHTNMYEVCKFSHKCCKGSSKFK